MKLNLGCGKKKLEGYLNCDNSELVNPDMIVDLEKLLPFKDNSVDEIIIYHVLEHINNYIQLVNEMNRICKDGSIIKIRVPHCRSIGAFANPTHVRFFSARSFDFFDGRSNEWEVGLDIAAFKVKSKLIYSMGKKLRYANYLICPLININKMTKGIYEKFISGIIPVDEIQFELEVIKDVRNLNHKRTGGKK